MIEVYCDGLGGKCGDDSWQIKTARILERYHTANFGWQQLIFQQILEFGNRESMLILRVDYTERLLRL